MPLPSKPELKPLTKEERDALAVLATSAIRGVEIDPGSASADDLEVAELLRAMLRYEATLRALEAENAKAESRYLSAVQGRAEFRNALREARAESSLSVPPGEDVTTSEKIREANKALSCLYIAVEESIARDVQAKCQVAMGSLVISNENLRARLAAQPSSSLPTPNKP